MSAAAAAAAAKRAAARGKLSFGDGDGDGDGDEDDEDDDGDDGEDEEDEEKEEEDAERRGGEASTAAAAGPGRPSRPRGRTATEAPFSRRPPPPRLPRSLFLLPLFLCLHRLLLRTRSRRRRWRPCAPGSAAVRATEEEGTAGTLRRRLPPQLPLLLLLLVLPRGSATERAPRPSSRSRSRDSVRRRPASLQWWN